MISMLFYLKQNVTQYCATTCLIVFLKKKRMVVTQTCTTSTFFFNFKICRARWHNILHFYNTKICRARCFLFKNHVAVKHEIFFFYFKTCCAHHVIYVQWCDIFHFYYIKACCALGVRGMFLF